MKNVVPQILGKAGGGTRAGKAAQPRTDKRNQRKPHHEKPDRKNVSCQAQLRALFLNPVYEVSGGNVRESRFNDRLAHHQDQCQDGRTLVFPDASQKPKKHE